MQQRGCRKVKDMKKYLLAVALLALTACSSKDKKDINKIAYLSTVYIETDQPMSGSAVYIGDNRFLTAGHMCDGTSKLLIRSNKTREIVKTSNIIRDKRFHKSDLCLFTVQKAPRELVGIKVATLDAQPTELVLLAGFPDQPLYFTHIAEVAGQYEVDLPEVSQVLSVALVRTVPGISGGPVINEAGELVGIVSAVSPSAGKTFFVPLPPIRQFINGQLGLPL
jgi:S1-C subfamily serine protease